MKVTFNTKKLSCAKVLFDCYSGKGDATGAGSGFGSGEGDPCDEDLKSTIQNHFCDFMQLSFEFGEQ